MPRPPLHPWRFAPALVPFATLGLFACTLPGAPDGGNVEVPATSNFVPVAGAEVSVADAAPRKPRFSPYVVIHNNRSPYRSPTPKPPKPSVSSAPPSSDPGATAPQYLGNLSMVLLAGGGTGAPADGTASGPPKAVLKTDPGTGTHPGLLGVAVKHNISFEAEEVLFVDGLGGNLRRFNTTTGQVTTLPKTLGEAVGQFGGITYDAATKVFYATDVSLRRVYRLTIPDPGGTGAPVVALVAGDPNATLGQGTPAVLDGVGTAARFAEPRGICQVGQTLYVADAGAHLIRRIDLSNSSNMVSTAAGSSTGKPNNLDEEVAATSAQFNVPIAVAGNLAAGVFIADQKNHLIRKLDIASGKVSVLGGSGQGLSIDGARGTASFNEPLGLAFTNSHLFVAERSTRIRAINLSTKAVFTALGSSAPGLNVGLKETAGFVNPLGLAPLVDGSGIFKAMFVLDGGNGQASLGARLVKFTGTL